MRYYGVSYYPEHRNEKEFTMDLDLITKAGLNLVRMGEFAWCRMEPREGEFDFTWLEEAVNRFGEAGIRTLLCTPTAALPQWMAERYPEVLFMDANGKHRKPGGRKHNCYNNETYRKFCRRIAGKLAEKFAANPYILGYQVDNELGQEGTARCCCPDCRVKFTQYLKDRYGSIDTLNESLGTIFWGQSYTDYSQVAPPQRSIEKGVTDLADMYVDNPSLRLAFENFSSSSLIEYFKTQHDAIKKYDSRAVTTNTTGLSTNCVDYSKLADEVDVFAVDSYPPLYTEETRQQRFCNAFSRSAKHKDFWVLEFSSGGGHALWGGKGLPQFYPGAIRTSVLKTFCDGAEVLLHFPFATFRFGAEQQDGAVLDADNIPRRRYFEIAQTAADLKRMDAILDETNVKKEEIAILLDYNSYWAMKIKPLDSKFDPFGYASEIFQLLKESGYQTAILTNIDRIGDYRMVIIPPMPIMTGRQQGILNHYVADGGNVVMYFASSIKNENNVADNSSFPAGMNEAAGMNVDEYEHVEKINQAGIEINLDGHTLHCSSNVWAETLNLTTAKAFGQYTDGYKKGWTVCSKNDYGKGRLYYIGTVLDKNIHGRLFEIITSGLGLWKTPADRNDIEIVCRESADGRRFWFLFNPLFKDAEICFDKPLTKQVTGETVQNTMIPSMGYGIFFESI